MDVESLKAAFSTNTAWAEYSAIAVFVGLLFDIFVILAFDLRDPEKSRWEIGFAFIGTAVIATGVFGEWRYGHRAADASRGLQRNFEQKIATLNHDTVELKYVLARFPNGRHVKVAITYSRLVSPIGYPSTVSIQSINDPEAARFACELAFPLQRWWNGHLVDESVTHISDSNIRDGVAITCSGCGGSDDKPVNNTVVQAEQLKRFLIDWPNVVAAKVVSPTNGVPQGGILILIGKHSIDFDMDVLALEPLAKDAGADAVDRQRTLREDTPFTLESGCVPKP